MRRWRAPRRGRGFPVHPARRFRSLPLPPALRGLGDVRPLPYIGAAAAAAAVAAAYAYKTRKDPATYAIFGGGLALVAALITYNVRGGT